MMWPAFVLTFLWIQVNAQDPCVSYFPRSCAEIYQTGQTHDGIYNIYPFPHGDRRRVPVYCDMTTDGGGWTVIQRRGQYGNPVHYFYRNWEEYKIGFGEAAKEFWIGNSVINAITDQEDNSLRIELKTHDEDLFVSVFSYFRVGDELNKYNMTVSGYNGVEAEPFLKHNGNKFTTFDNDNDKDENNCAEVFKGGWWYYACHCANYNGLNFNGRHSIQGAEGINECQRKGFQYSYLGTEMKIRPTDFNRFYSEPARAKKLPPFIIRSPLK